MDKELSWEDHYENLRTMHSYLKLLMNHTVSGIPHFAGGPRPMPEEYRKKLEKINNALYVAEKYASKRMF